MAFDPAYPLAKTRAASYNPRVIEPGALDVLRASLRLAGMVKPLIVTADGLTVAGHQRGKAARAEGTGPFVALVTAVDRAAPPILQWDREERRNPVSWYHYVNGSHASRWGLTAGSYVRVTAVTRKPSMWGSGHEHHGKDAFFLLDGARDTGHATGGGIFPEMLRSEYHAIRKTSEAHVRDATIVGRDEATACGIAFAKQTFRVTSQDGSRRVITLDRWD